MTKSKRTHFSQLPPNQELKKILDTESKRLPPTEKKFIHYLTFKEVAEWLKAVRLDDELFIGNPKIEKILEIGEKLQQKVVQKTLRGISIADKNLLASLSKITDYMNLEHQPQKSDLVLVFGSRSLKRVEKAVELWKAKIAPIILFSGGHPHYKNDNQIPEAVVFAQHAISLGVPKEIILIESNSITIADNVKTSLNLMDNLGIKYQRIATVGAWFMQRRAWSHLIKLSSAKTKIFCTNAPISSPDLKVNTWFTNEVGIKTIFGEFVKLKLSVALNTA